MNPYVTVSGRERENGGNGELTAGQVHRVLQLRVHGFQELQSFFCCVFCGDVTRKHSENDGGEKKKIIE